MVMIMVLTMGVMCVFSSSFDGGHEREVLLGKDHFKKDVVMEWPSFGCPNQWVPSA
jgi:hypothetical protein